MKQVRIKWKSKTTDFQSDSEWFDISKENILKKWVEKMNRECSELKHWLEYK